MENENFKYCQHCGAQIAAAAVVCPSCGRQVQPFQQPQQQAQQQQAAPPPIIINNTNTNMNGIGIRPKNKWVALLLCFFLGFLGAHKFYEGKVGMGILYIFTFGLCLVGVLIDFITILFKPNPYYI